MEKDLTVIFLTLNKTPEHFAEYQKNILLESIGDYPLITISRKPLDFGENLIDTDEPGYQNIYRQILKGAKLAKTPYIAIAEDDVLYTKEHFEFYRPPLDKFAYNQHRWALFAWGTSIYSMRNRKSNCSLIAPRELTVEALEERFQKCGEKWNPGFVGELGRSRVEEGLKVTKRKSVEVFSEIAIIQFNHKEGTEATQRNRKKAVGFIKANKIPYWGNARDLRKEFR